MSMTRLAPSLVFALELAACSGGTRFVEATVEVLVPREVTEIVNVTELVEVTRVIEIESTSVPATLAPTATRLTSIEEVRSEVLRVTRDFIEGQSDVEALNLLRFNQGKLEIELSTIWASQDRQPDVSFEIVRGLATGFIQGGMSKEDMARIADGSDFSIVLTTYSTDGGYRYQSVTTYDVLVALDSLSISYDEWVAAANAGFR